MKQEIKAASRDVIEVGLNIQKQREIMGLSQEELGNEIGSSGQTISKYETGTREMGINRLFEICDVLQVTPRELCPERFDTQEGTDPRLFQIGEQLKKLDAASQNLVIQAMEAMIAGLRKQIEPQRFRTK